MIRDVKSNCLIATAIAAASISAGVENGAAFDHSLANSVSFFIDAGTVGGEVDAKLQYSDDGTTWTDEDGASGNDTAIAQMSAAGSAQLNVVNPQGRYSRVVVTVGTTTAVLSMTSVGGPLRTVVPTDA